MSRILRVMGVCAGSGAALLYPFKEDSKYKVVGNIEPRGVFHTPDDINWALNFGDIPFLRTLELPDWEPDVIVSSPDCGASSMMRLSKKKKLGKPHKNRSIKFTIKAIKHYQPHVFLLENLPKLLNFIPREKFEKKFPNYKLIFHHHSVMEFGNSQKSRVRLIIIGVREDSRIKPEQFEVIYKVREPKLTGRLLSAHDKKLNFRPKLDKKLAMYDYRKLPSKDNLTVEEVQKLWKKDFKKEYKWPIKTSKMKTLPGVYRLKSQEYPLTVRPSDRQFDPKGWPLGIQDFQLIMGIPITFKLYIPEDENYNYYLNKARYAICKGSVYEVGEWFKRSLWRNPSTRAKKAHQRVP